MKYLPLLAKEDVEDPALKEKWFGYPFDLALFHVMAHNPAEFVSYTTFNRTVWTEHEGGMPLLLKEIAVVQVAVISDSSYEWGNHGAQMIRRGGSQEQVDALIAGDVESDLFDKTEKLVLKFTTEVTVDAMATEETLTAMAEIFTPKQIGELTYAIGCYMLNSRFANLGGCVIGDDKKWN